MFPYEVILRLSCVVYFLMVGKAESSFGTSPAGVEYVRAVSLCSLLFFSFFYITSRRASRPASRFACRRSSRLASRPASRFASRLCVSPCVAVRCVSCYVVSSCVPVCVSFCVPFSLLICGARPDFRIGAVSFCLPLAVSPWRLVLGVRDAALYAVLASRPCVPLLRFAMRSVLRSDMRAALYYAWLLARGRWFS